MTIKPPAGGAVVLYCWLLHAAGAPQKLRNYES